MSRIIKILFFSANALDSTGRPRIRPETESREIEEKLGTGKDGRLFKLIKLSATRIDDLQAGLNLHRPHVVHFSGHGSPSGIELEDEIGRITIVDMQALANLFKALEGRAYGSRNHRVSLIVLNACRTREHAESLTAVSDFTIGTASEVWDQDAINFAASFYNSLANGQSLNSALLSGLGVTKIRNFNANHAPKIFSGEGADPDEPFIEHVLGSRSQASATTEGLVPQIVPTPNHQAPKKKKKSTAQKQMEKRYSVYQEEMEKENERLQELLERARSASRKREKKS